MLNILMEKYQQAAIAAILFQTKIKNAILNTFADSFMKMKIMEFKTFKKRNASKRLSPRF